jgi:hypothetical protein
MSRYKIYQIDHYDPKLVGKKKRRLAVLYGALFSISYIIFHICIYIFNIKSFIMFSTLTPLVLGLYVWIYYRLKSDLKRIKTIGDIEFTRTTIKKRIGDSITEYEFRSIEKIQLQKHIPSINAGMGKTGYFSYILTIIFKNSASESLIISERPVGNSHNLSIGNTLNTLKKITEPQITIISQ